MTNDLRAILIASLAALAACGTPPEQTPPDEGPEEGHVCGGEEAPETYIIRSLAFVPADGRVSEGLDIDGVVSDQSDPIGCYKEDYTSPDGREGIDNQFATLLPALELAGGGDEAIAGIFERTIESGNVLLMLGTRRVDDPVDDECVAVSLWRASGEPLIDALGEVERGQTFELDEEQDAFHLTDATLSGGTFEAGPFELDLPMTIDQFDIFMSIKDARVAFEIEDDGVVRGYIAGGVLVEDIVGIVEVVGGAGGNVLDLVVRQVKRNVDVLPDAEGKCQAISIALAFEAVPAFFYSDYDVSIPDE